MLVTQQIAPHAIVENIAIKNFPHLAQGYYLNLALMYAEWGFYVFPVNPNKIPYKGFAWSKLATNDPDKIRALWQIYPNGRPAFYCRKSGVLVLDTDNKPEKGKDGFKVLNQLVEELGLLPKTILIYTQSNGTHMYFKLPENRKFKRKISNCIDIQTNHYCLCGGVYTVKGSYRFAKGYTFEKIGNIPNLPDKWVDFLSKPDNKTKNREMGNIPTEKKELIEGDFQKLYENCLFCKMCVDSASILDENSWFRFAVILSNLKNGFEIFDRFSRPHPDYTPEKTQAKFDNAKKYTVKCSTIAVDFQGCRQCINRKK